LSHEEVLGYFSIGEIHQLTEKYSEDFFVLCFLLRVISLDYGNAFQMSMLKNSKNSIATIHFLRKLGKVSWIFFSLFLRHKLQNGSRVGQ